MVSFMSCNNFLSLEMQINSIFISYKFLAQSAGAVEYTDFTSAEW